MANNTSCLFNFTLDLNKSMDSGFTLAPTCDAILGRILYLSIIAVVTVAANILLGFTVNIEWKHQRSPDKILIFNLILANLATLLITLPMEAALVADFEHYINCSRPQTILLFDVTFDLKTACNFVTLATLALIGFDRYEALTKFPHQRKLDVKLACISAAAIWGAAVAVVTFVSVGPLKYHCIILGEDKEVNKAFVTARIAVITIWTTVCCTVETQFFRLAAVHIKTHREAIHAMFGHKQTVENISFTFSSIALSFAFIVAWVPYGIVVAILSRRENSVSNICLELWVQTFTYISAGLAPLIYLFMDKRLKTNFKQMFKGSWSPSDSNRTQSFSSTTLEHYHINQPTSA
ncbi:predicted protein [Nematostella vectensis]|uniref:G-protein coupled receptors family 1 profile domain-containing protein n=1 Tax=Nematostella vectensis TaxID=45351 RepID=A7SFL8_NEMVE|nr:predicted protein [Nematostella vectensis]|eukprot:XP_001629552.1 predicted protein [Nematostella vectensis]